jgi:hypothetical protein
MRRTLNRSIVNSGVKSGSSGTRKHRKISRNLQRYNPILWGIDLELCWEITSKVWCSKWGRGARNSAQIHQKFLVCRGFCARDVLQKKIFRFSGSFRFVSALYGGVFCRGCACFGVNFGDIPAEFLDTLL